MSETEAKRLLMATQVNVLKVESQLSRYARENTLQSHGTAQTQDPDTSKKII